jgi:hypothetical protein
MPTTADCAVTLPVSTTLLRGRTAAQIAEVLGIDASTVQHIQKSLGLIVDFAAAKGVTGTALAELAGDEIRRVIESPLAEGYATPEEGAGFVDGGGRWLRGTWRRPPDSTASPRPVTAAAITERIRKRDVIAYRTGGKQYRIPRWQFRKEGGVLPGLSSVLEQLRKSDTSYNDLTPFTFFLQPHVLTQGRTPLEVLREGDLEAVVRAAKSEEA